MKQILRPFQAEALAELRSRIRQGAKRLLLVAPTGAGKTTIAAALIEGAAAKNNGVLFLAHRKELIDQASARLDESGIAHGVIMAGHWRWRPEELVQVASIQTLIRREIVSRPAVVVIDEAHRSRGESYRRILQAAPEAFVIGLTATPCRTDGRGLGGELFEHIVECPQIGELIRLGFLVPPRTYGGPPVDLSGVAKVQGDYQLDQLALRMNTPKLVGDVVKNWRRLASDRQTVVFAVNVAHSMAIQREFAAAGVAAEHLDGETPKVEREGILARLANRETQVVVNCAVLTEGWDSPGVSCCVIARPTQSLSLYLQMAGRALRTAPGKSDCLILDHGNCYQRHGLVTDEREWTLDKDKPKGATLSAEENVKVCPECNMVCSKMTRVCQCGYVFSQKADDLIVKEANLELITAATIQAGSRHEYEWWLYQQYTRTKLDGSPYSQHYAFAKYISKYKTKPPFAWRREWERKHPWLLARPAVIGDRTHDNHL